MALPPLELFSLRIELPCCRAALSVSETLSGIRCRGLRFVGRIGPFLAAVFAFPGVHRLGRFEYRVFRTACGTAWQLELRHRLARLIDDVLWDGVGDDGAGAIELVGRDLYPQIA